MTTPESLSLPISGLLDDDQIVALVIATPAETHAAIGLSTLPQPRLLQHPLLLAVGGSNWALLGTQPRREAPVWKPNPSGSGYAAQLQLVLPLGKVGAVDHCGTVAVDGVDHSGRSVAEDVGHLVG